jgi:hypothetical protein
MTYRFLQCEGCSGITEIYAEEQRYETANSTDCRHGSNGGMDDDSGSTGNYASPNIGTLVYVPAGSFQRDATETNISVISRPFRMSEHEVT